MQRRVTQGHRAGVALVLLAALLSCPARAGDPLTPAELPPESYRGQQYVDSRGCLFLRAGSSGTEWIPRVTREGVPQCGYPPSGTRVPVAGEAEAVAAPVTPDGEAAPTPPEPTPAETEAAGPTIVGGHLVAVGSFAVPENVEKAIARLEALNYPVAQAWPSGSDGAVTVFAGPFATVEDAVRAERELRGAGFPDAIRMSH